MPSRTTVVASWGTPSNGGEALTGFGVLAWNLADGDIDYGTADVVGASTRSKTYSNLSPGTYTFGVHACNGTDSCGYWTFQDKTVLPPPPPPLSGFNATARGSRSDPKIHIRWDADSGYDDYEVDHDGTLSGRPTDYWVSDLEPCTEYTVSVRPNGDGTTYQDSWGSWSSKTLTTVGCLTNPPAPSGFHVTVHGKTNIKLAWDSLSGTTKYRVDGQSSNITGTSYNVTGLECDTDYTFRVSAYGDGDTYAEEWGAKATLSTSTSACIVPPAGAVRVRGDGEDRDQHHGRVDVAERRHETRDRGPGRQPHRRRQHRGHHHQPRVDGPDGMHDLYVQAAGLRRRHDL